MEVKRVLVAGGAGFIGSHLVDELIKRGHEVTIVDNLSTGKKENLNPKAKFYDLDNNKALKESGWIPDYSFDKGLKETVDWFKEK